VRGFLVLIVLVIALSGPSGAQAQSLPASCGAEEHELLKQTAWQHAQREVEMAQRIILKPDSVLEYTCFQDELNRPGISGVNAIAAQPLIRYLFGSYGATFGGGTYERDVNEGGDSLNCDIMNRVWQFLKCQNFGAADDSDGFFTFETLAVYDPRREPVECGRSDAKRDGGDSEDKRPKRLDKISKGKWEEANTETDFRKPLAD